MISQNWSSTMTSLWQMGKHFPVDVIHLMGRERVKPVEPKGMG